MLKVYVIILNWNRKKDTLECIKSVSKLLTSKFQLQILVVDNFSSDGSVEAIRALEFPNLEIIVNKKNLGFAEGNNVGIRYALSIKADYVLILNNDTIIDKNLLVHLVKVIKKDKRVAALSPKIYFAGGYEYHKDRYHLKDLGRVIWSAGGRIDWDNVYCSNRGVDEVDKKQYNQIEEVDFATGSCIFLRSEALRQIGLFDWRYFMYLEDVDLCMRLKKKGWKILYVPKAFLWHKVAQSSKIGGELNDYFITRNRLLFGLKYAPLRSKLALVKESMRLLLNGRKWQKKAVVDFYSFNFGKGSWK